MQNLAHKTRLHVNNKQATFLKKCVGFRRVAFNTGLDIWKKMYEAHKENPELPSPNWAVVSRAFTLVKQQSENAWMYELPACVGDHGIMDLGKAFKNFYERLKKGEAKAGYPKFKARGINDAFYLKGVKLDGNKIKFPKCEDWFKLADLPKQSGRVISCTVSHKAGKWWIALTLEVEDFLKAPAANADAVGLDFGVVNLFTDSNGKVYEPAKALAQHEKQKKRIQRKLARQTVGSQNRQKTKLKLQKIENRIANVRNTHAHEVTTEIVKNHQTIVIEDLKIKNMTKSAKGDAENPGKNVRQKAGLNRSILDNSPGELKRQLEYKTAWHGGTLVKVKAAYTSQACSKCGHTEKANRKTQAEFVCQKCGFTANADFNAAKNILSKYSASTS